MNKEYPKGHKEILKEFLRIRELLQKQINEITFEDEGDMFYEEDLLFLISLTEKAVKEEVLKKIKPILDLYCNDLSGLEFREMWNEINKEVKE